MILLTGANGLLGRELMRQMGAAGLAARGVDIVSTNDAAVQRGDLLDPAVCRRVCDGVETVIHAAARQHHSDMPRWGRRRFFHANVIMTENLVDAAIAAGVRQFVFVSSDMVYGIPRGRTFRETDEPHPIGPYGSSKLASERACEGAADRGVAVTILRPRLIIGPGRLGVLTKLFDRVRSGRSVPVFGTGHHRYQMVAVSDVATACILAVQRRIDGVFNLGSDRVPSVRELLTELCRRAGSPSRVLSLPRHAAGAVLWALHGVRFSPLSPEQFRIADVDYVLDTTRAREQLGWTPEFNDTDMLIGAYESYRAGFDNSPLHPPADSYDNAASAILSEP